MPPECPSHTERSREGRNCTHSQTTTAPEQNLSVKHHLQQEQRQFLHRDLIRKKAKNEKNGTGVNSQCVWIFLL